MTKQKNKDKMLNNTVRLDRHYIDSHQNRSIVK